MKRFHAWEQDRSNSSYTPLGGVNAEDAVAATAKARRRWPEVDCLAVLPRGVVPKEAGFREVCMRTQLGIASREDYLVYGRAVNHVPVKGVDNAR